MPKVNELLYLNRRGKLRKNYKVLCRAEDCFEEKVKGSRWCSYHKALMERGRRFGRDALDHRLPGSFESAKR